MMSALEPKTNGCLQAALNYVAKNLPIFPCNANKEPLVSGGFKAATRDPQTINRWWKRWPDALIGMPTGPDSGVEVLDIDARNDRNGFAAIPNWQSLSPVAARTRSGGIHVYFIASGVRCTTDRIALGVDTRGEGGYVIIPPSPGYTWVNGSDFFNLPTWPHDLRPQLRSEGQSTGENPTADIGLISAALAVIPNDDVGYDDWNRLGMATWRATSGSDEGCAAFDRYSKKSIPVFEEINKV
jgi:hypothetical protein